MFCRTEANLAVVHHAQDSDVEIDVLPADHVRMETGTEASGRLRNLLILRGHHDLPAYAGGKSRLDRVREQRLSGKLGQVLPTQASRCPLRGNDREDFAWRLHAD